MTQEQITLTMINGDFSNQQERAILQKIIERLTANECPPDSSAEFVFSRMIRKKSPPGIYLGPKKNARAVPITVVFDGHSAVKGYLKPIRYAGERKMTVKELNEFLKIPVKKLEVSPTSTPKPQDKPSEQRSTLVPLVEKTPEKVRYTRTEMMQDAFVSLFKELLLILFRDAGKPILTAREVVELANKSEETFFEDNRMITSVATGNLLSRLSREGFLDIDSSNKAFARYSLAEMSKVSRDEGRLEVKTPPMPTPIISKPEKVLSDKKGVAELEQLLAKKASAQKAEAEAQQALSEAQQCLKKAQDELKSVDTQLESYRSLYMALSETFGKS